MESATMIFDACLFLAGVMMALVVALFVAVAGYELLRAAVKSVLFERRMRRRMRVESPE